VDYRRKQNLKKKEKEGIRWKSENFDERAHVQEEKKKENCIGLSHHNININENDLINAKT
jgi:hypothetical protein